MNGWSRVHPNVQYAHQIVNPVTIVPIALVVFHLTS